MAMQVMQQLVLQNIRLHKKREQMNLMNFKGCLKRQPLFLSSILILLKFTLIAQENIKISGIVFDEVGRGVGFANMFVKQTNQQYLTKEDGSFVFDLNPVYSDTVIKIIIRAFGFELNKLILPIKQNELCELKIGLFKEIQDVPEVSYIFNRPEIKPLIKSALKALPDNYSNEYYSEYICDDVYMQNKHFIIKHFTSHGELLIPSKFYKGKKEPKVQVSSIYIHENINPLRVEVVKNTIFPLEKAFAFYNFLEYMNSSKNYDIQFIGIRNVNSRPCYHITYNPSKKANQDKKRYSTGYVDIDTNSLAILRFNRHFSLSENQEEEQFRYNIGPIGFITKMKGYWREEDLYASFKLENNSIVIDHINYLHKVLVVYPEKRGREYLSSQNDVKFLNSCDSTDMIGFTPTLPRRIPVDSLDNYNDSTFWDNYFNKIEINLK
jgi:hypothetical protein